MDKKIITLEDIKALWNAGKIGITIYCEDFILDWDSDFLEALQKEDILEYYRVVKNEIIFHIKNNDYI